MPEVRVVRQFTTPSRPSRYGRVNVRLLERLAAMVTAQDTDRASNHGPLRSRTSVG